MSSSLADQLRDLGVDIPSLDSVELDTGEVLYFTTHAYEPIELWKKLRAIVPKTEHWPLLAWDETIIEDRLEWPPDDAHTLLSRSEALDARAWLDRRIGLLKNFSPEFGEETAADLLLLRPKPRHDFNFNSPHFQQAGRSRASILVLVPTTESWHVSLALCFGSFNECPEPEEHACILRHWQQQYGAELVWMHHDSIELYVNNPPLQPLRAFGLAQDQIAYCPDMPETGRSVAELTSALLGGTVWSFWWD